MSWPSDGLPRFKVTVIEGGYGDDDHPIKAPHAYVYDRARCHRIMAKHTGRRARSKAEKTVARLVRLTSGETPKPIPPGSRLRHGTYSCYVNLQCRCFECAEYTRRARRASYNATKEAKP